jgi:predicted MFS family arabinose efflux permease
MLDPMLETRIREWRKAPRYFLAFLQALQFKNANLAPIRRLDATEWNELLSFSDRAHLTLQLSQLPSDVLPAWVSSRIQENVTDNTKRIERIRTLYQEVASTLRRANADHIVIKGFTQYPEYVKSPNLRMQSDIDLYCPPNTILTARNALRDVGYEAEEPQKHVPVDHFPAMVRNTGWRWRGNAFDPEMPPAIELHYCLWNEQAAQFDIPEVEQFWYRRVEHDTEGYRFSTLHPVDHLAFCSLQVLRDLFRGDWVISHVYELAYFLETHTHDEEFWTSWQETHSDSLRSLEVIAFRLARIWFGCATPIQVKEQIERMPPAIKQWFECFCSSFLELMFVPRRDGVWLHVALLESTGAKLSVVRTGLLPTRVPPLQIADKTPSIDRTFGQPKYSSRGLRYSAYVAARAVFYGRVLLRGAMSGIRWWRSQRRLSSPFWAFFAASCFWSLGLSAFFFLFNLFLIEHGFSEKLVGGLTSTMAAGTMAATLPIGWIARKCGLRRVLLSGFTLAICIFPLRVLLLWPAAQWALAFLAGIALAVWAVCLSPALAQLTTEKNRPFAFSVVFSSGVGLAALGNLIGGNLAAWLRRLPQLTAHANPNQAALLIACAIAAMGIFPLASVKFRAQPQIEQRNFVKSRFLVRFLPAIALWGLAIGAFTPFATIYFSRHLGMSTPRVGLTFSVAQVFQFIGILAAPFLFRKSGRLSGIVYSEIAAAMALGALAVFRQPSVAGVLYVSYTTVQWMSEPGIYSLLMESVPVEERSTASAWNTLVLSASQAVAAACAGAALVRFGYAAVLSVAAAVAFVAACSFKPVFGSREAEPSANRLSSAASPSAARP